jgi:hypothetical protein
MKRIYFIITMLLVVVSSNAEVLNYRGVNVTSYIGDTLLVRPFPQNDSRDFYKGFKDFYEFTNETSEFNALANYKFDYKENNHVGGVDEKYLAGKQFVVNKVYKHSIYEYTYVFELTNIRDKSDICKYVYNADYKHINNIREFPFISFKYLRFLMGKYANTNVIVSLQRCSSTKEKLEYIHTVKTYPEKTHVVTTDIYKKFKVIDIYLDGSEKLLMFRLSDGTSEYCCPAGLIYEESPLYYHASTKVFTMKEYNTIKRAYGENIMTHILNGSLCEGMNISAAYLAAGSPSVIKKYETYTLYKWYINGDYACAKVINNQINSIYYESAYTAAKNSYKDVKQQVKDGRQSLINVGKDLFNKITSVAE